MTPFKFLKIALTDYWIVAALMPTSKYAIRKILNQFRPEHRTVIEYGAGDGVITKEILRVLPADGKILAIELNPDLLAELQKIQDPRLEIWHGDVLDLIGSLPKSDVIISGIPFSQISHEKREAIIRQTAATLNEGGLFIAYQNSSIILKIMKRFFSQTKWYFEPRNFLPYFVLIGKK